MEGDHTDSVQCFVQPEMVYTSTKHWYHTRYTRRVWLVPPLLAVGKYLEVWSFF